MKNNPAFKQTNPRMSRRSFLVRGAAAVLAACAVPLYALYGERGRVAVTSRELVLGRLPRGFDGIRIVHFSDIHYGFYYGEDELARLIELVQQLEPDLLVFTGDLFDADVEPHAEACARLLERLHAPLGKLAVMGNHDYYTGYRGKLAYAAYEAGGFRVLRNENVTLTRRGDTIAVAGVDDMLFGQPDLPLTFGGIPADRFTLFLAHEPEYANRAESGSFDLQLSGHSHGGQVRLPLVGEIITPPGGRSYVQGLHALPVNGRFSSYIYTNRGIGTSKLPIRVNCRPEVSVHILRSSTAVN